MAVKRGTTPIYTLNIGGKSLKKCRVFVTFEQDGKAITKTGDDIDVENKVDESGEPLSVISVSLTQSDTLGFDTGVARVQVNWIDQLGNRGETDIETINFEPTLLDEVIRYE